MPPDSYKSSSFYVENEEVFDEPKKIIWNDEKLPNTHLSRLKILRWTMKEWSKNYNYPMDSAKGREFIRDEDWVIERISHEVLMDDSQRRRANHLFKKYGGNRRGMDFTRMEKVYP